MKKLVTLIGTVGLIIVLAACSPGATAATSAPSGTEAAGTVVAPNGTPGPGGFQRSGTSLLVFGTFALEGTANAVTAEQAKTLLPLWQGLQALSTSDTTAAAELTAVETQLRAAYTADQLAVIDALTQEQIQKVMTDQGISFGGRGANADGTPVARGTGFPGGGGGFGGPGGPPDGGGGGGFDPNNISPEQQATFEARRAAGGGGFGGGGGAGVPTPLLQAVIDMLTTRAAS